MPASSKLLYRSSDTEELIHNETFCQIKKQCEDLNCKGSLLEEYRQMFNDPLVMIDNFDISKTHKDIRKSVPLLAKLLCNLLDINIDIDYNESTDPSILKILVYVDTLIQILLRDKNQKCNGFSLLLTMILLHEGASVKSIDLLNKLGICTGARTANEQSKIVMNGTYERIKTIADIDHYDKFLLCIDNINISILRPGKTSK